MKKFLLLACCICSIISLVQAQEQEKDSWNGAGLSAAKCQWVHVRYTFENGVEGWKKCDEADEGTSQCVGKFCNNVEEGQTDQKWKKEECNKYCITLQEVLPIEGGNEVKSISGNSGVDLLGNYFGMWYKIGALVLGLICVLVIVISGVQITFGGASEEAVTSAKARIWGALLSLILLFSSALILKTINPLFFT